MKEAKDYLNNYLFKFSICNSYKEFVTVNNLWKENILANSHFHDFMYSLPMYKSNEEFSREDLERDYNSAYAALQMRIHWDLNQRDIDILPFVQFDCVMDAYATELDHILHKKVIRADDPILSIIYPPNYYADRTIMRWLRKNEGFNFLNIEELPEIAKAFSNNVGKAFTINQKEFFTIPVSWRNIRRVKRYYRKYHF